MTDREHDALVSRMITATKSSRGCDSPYIKAPTTLYEIALREISFPEFFSEPAVQDALPLLLSELAEAISRLRLNWREKRILNGLIAGKEVKEIAGEVGLAAAHMFRHVEPVRQKLDRKLSAMPNFGMRQVYLELVNV